MKKSIYIAILALVIFSFAGCSTPNANSNGTGNEAKTDKIETKRDKSVKEQAQALLDQDKPLEAAELVQEAIEEEASEVLEEYLAYICSHTIVTEMITTYSEGDEEIFRYDDFGRRIYTKTAYYCEESEYDARGNQKLVKVYDEDGKISSISEYEYNDKDILVSSFTRNNENVVRYGIEYEYNANGDLTKSTSYGENKIVTSTNEYNYDGEKQTSTKSTYYDGNGDLRYISTLFYQDGNISGTEMEYPDGTKVNESYQNEYDDHNNQIKYRKYGNDGKLTASTDSTYEYNKNGDILKETTTDNLNDAIYYIENTYDKNGNLTSAKMTHDDSEAKGAFEQYYEMEWDDENRVLRYTTYDYDFTTVQYEEKYEYTEDGGLVIHIRETNGDGYTNTEYIANKYNLAVSETYEGNVYTYEYDALRNRIRTLYNNETESTVAVKYHFNPEVDYTNIGELYYE